ncbi:MAG TPA: hypothetical protein PK691_05740 [Thermomicrobiales bacterium]|nr:hypothetical protein [Thermomicrobiales bacterium]HRA48725.1 hypothetical protein [Thermomicrobiales bacterium]
MGRRLVPIGMVAAMIAFMVAAIAIGIAPWRLGTWNPSVRLIVAGGILPMIYSVSFRVMPVFGGRTWRHERLLQIQIGATLVGAWSLFAGGLWRLDRVQTFGHVLLLAGVLLFLTSIGLMFSQPRQANRPPPPLPYPEHRAIDRIARGFTMLATIYLLFGVGSGLYAHLWKPHTGRWDLVWAHSLLVGFMLSMISGVSYHVLARWTGARWRFPRLIPLQFLTTVICLPLMILAFATDRSTLFEFAGPIQATALLLLLVNLVPMARALPQLSRYPIMLAIVALTIGLYLGALFAGHPADGARYRLVHAELNLFGFTGLLISGMAYYLVPRLFGHPLRLPRLAPIQIGLLTLGVAANALVSVWRIERGGPAILQSVTHGVIALSFGLLGVIIALTTLAARPGRTVSTLSLSRSAPGRPLTSGRTLVHQTPAD